MTLADTLSNLLNQYVCYTLVKTNCRFTVISYQ